MSFRFRYFFSFSSARCSFLIQEQNIFSFVVKTGYWRVYCLLGDFSVFLYVLYVLSQFSIHYVRNPYSLANTEKARQLLYCCQPRVFRLGKTRSQMLWGKAPDADNIRIMISVLKKNYSYLDKGKQNSLPTFERRL